MLKWKKGPVFWLTVYIWIIELLSTSDQRPNSVISLARYRELLIITKNTRRPTGSNRVRGKCRSMASQCSEGWWLGERRWRELSVDARGQPSRTMNMLMTSSASGDESHEKNGKVHRSSISDNPHWPAGGPAIQSIYPAAVGVGTTLTYTCFCLLSFFAQRKSLNEFTSDLV